MNLVIGSGPAGVACASALLERGAEVRMLDGGVTLEPERAALVEKLRRQRPDEWSRDDLAAYRAGMNPDVGGVPLKLVYGSDFAYREAGERLGLDYGDVGIRASLARGGLGNVWGAAMLPFSERDTAGWPVRAAELAEHYAAVLKLTNCSARRDDLENFFPLHHAQPAALTPGRQAQQLLRNLERHRDALAHGGIHFGQARVAVKVARDAEPGCVYCGLCMYGCPYGYIYNADATLREMESNPRFSYQPGSIVTRVEESADGARVRGLRRADGAPFELRADRVYLAAGVIATTQILLRSLGLYDHTVELKDSQYFLVPLALARDAGDVRREALNTLSQVFLEILDPEISPHTVHLQVYSWNDLIGQTVRKKLGPLGALDFLASRLERRLLIIQGYLHSNHSGRVALTLKKDGARGDRLELAARLNPETKPTIRRVLRKLRRHARQLGAMPVSPLLQLSPPGRGFHSGGTFPMSAQAAAGTTDVLGRPRGWQRVHVVDATVLPEIPATTIVLSAMANAHRIGWETA